MPYDENLFRRIEAAVSLLPETVRAHLAIKKMFGGIAYLYHGKMAFGVVREQLVCRATAKLMPTLLERDGVRPMDFTGKPMKEFLFVSQEALAGETELLEYLEYGLAHARHSLQK